MTGDRLSLDSLLDAFQQLEAAARPDPEPEPRPLGRFSVLGQLGAGAYAIVAKAHDPQLDRHVALKLPRPEFLIDPARRSHFLREAQAAGRLGHEGIVRVLEVVEEGPTLVYLVLELVDGPTLEQWLDENLVVPVRLACEIVAAIADAAQHAHDRGVLHLDLKPSNVLLDTQQPGIPGVGRPKVTDFGLARVLNVPRRRKTTVLFAGTPGFMAPEQLAESPAAVSARTDVWSLGAILFQLLTGRLPFEGSPTAVALQVLHGIAPSPSTFRPDVPPDVAGIALKCLENKPDRRYVTAREMADDLRRVVAGERLTVSSRRLRAWQYVGIGAAALAVTLVILLWPRPMHIGEQSNSLSQPNGDSGVAREELLNVRESFVNSVGMKMNRIEPGKFYIGSPSELEEAGVIRDNEAGREVEMTAPYWLGTKEVTISQYRRFVRATGHQQESLRSGKIGTGYDPVLGRKHGRDIEGDFTFENPGYPVANDHPAVNVSWHSAVRFCEWLSGLEGRTYRLPSEAEWERACRAGRQYIWCFGAEADNFMPRYANSLDVNYYKAFDRPIPMNFFRDDGYAFSSPVGSFQPNDWGFHDMHGNVWEWCVDVYLSSYKGWDSPINPVNLKPTTPNRVLRGGGFETGDVGMRSAFRLEQGPETRGFNVGFRVVCEAK